MVDLCGFTSGWYLWCVYCFFLLMCIVHIVCIVYSWVCPWCACVRACAYAPVPHPAYVQTCARRSLPRGQTLAKLLLTASTSGHGVGWRQARFATRPPEPVIEAKIPRPRESKSLCWRPRWEQPLSRSAPATSTTLGCRWGREFRKSGGTFTFDINENYLHACLLVHTQ